MIQGTADCQSKEVVVTIKWQPPFSYFLIYSKMRYNAEQASLSQATSSASRWGERVSKTRWW